jgi:nitrite reductase (NO-forming)
MNLELYRRAPALLVLIGLAVVLAGCGQLNTAATSAGMLEIHAVDLGFRPGDLAVAQPGRYTVKLVNDGAMLHDITFPGGTKIVANAGETWAGAVDVPAGGVTFVCSVAGHAQGGMTGRIRPGTAGVGWPR